MSDTKEKDESKYISNEAFRTFNELILTLSGDELIKVIIFMEEMVIAREVTD